MPDVKVTKAPTLLPEDSEMFSQSNKPSLLSDASQASNPTLYNLYDWTETALPELHHSFEQLDSGLTFADYLTSKVAEKDLMTESECVSILMLIKKYFAENNRSESLIPLLDSLYNKCLDTLRFFMQMLGLSPYFEF